MGTLLIDNWRINSPGESCEENWRLYWRLHWWLHWRIHWPIHWRFRWPSKKRLLHGYYIDRWLKVNYTRRTVGRKLTATWTVTLVVTLTDTLTCISTVPMAVKTTVAWSPILIDHCRLHLADVSGGRKTLSAIFWWQNRCPSEYKSSTPQQLKQLGNAFFLGSTFARNIIKRVCILHTSILSP